jgi:cell division inhibitor SepF
MLYLGLVDEDEMDDGQADAPYRSERNDPAASPRVQAGPQTAPAAPVRQLNPNRGARRIEPPDPSRRRSVAEPRITSESGVVVRHGDYGTGAGHAEVITAHSFADAKRLADLIRERVPVVVNLRDTEPDMVRRLVDFSSGLIYALDGTMKKVADGVILVSPPRVTLSPDEERRLTELGLYSLT